jgi:outer membrane protein assembly factor BamD
MFGKRLSILVLSIFLLASTGCSKYQRLLKSSDLEAKYNAAIKYYNDEDYFRAMTLLEELKDVFRATKKAEKVLYYYAMSNYGMKDFPSAALYFDYFVKTFPNSDKAEECQFMMAYCYYLDSPSSSLDQEYTTKAVNELQLFVNKYPASTRVEHCNDLIDMLREKLQTKEFNNAKLYYTIGDYKAAVVALKGLLKDYPDSKYREEVYFLVMKSHYLYANNSIEIKKEERYKASADAYLKFVDAFPQSKYLKEAETIYNTTLKQLDKYKSTNS